MKIPTVLGNTLISTIIREKFLRHRQEICFLSKVFGLEFRSTHPDANEKNLDDEIDENFLDTTGYELTLPSGRKIGHRTLVRYYRQNLSNRNTERSIEIVNKLKDKYRALGWSGPGTTGSSSNR